MENSTSLPALPQSYAGNGGPALAENQAVFPLLTNSPRFRQQQREKISIQKEHIVRLLKKNEFHERRRRRLIAELEPRRKEIRNLVRNEIYGKALNPLRKNDPFGAMTEEERKAARLERVKKRQAAASFMKEAEKKWNDRLRDMNDYLQSMRNNNKNEEILFSDRAVLMDGRTVRVLPSIHTYSEPKSVQKKAGSRN